MKDNGARGRVASNIGQFGLIPIWIFERVSLRAIALFGLLSAHADRAGNAFPGKARLCQMLGGCSEERLRAALRELERAGAVKTTPRFREDGSQTSNDYLLLYTPPEDRTLPSDGSLPTGSDRSLPKEQDQEGKSTELLRSSGTPAKNAPKLVLVDGRNLGFDALAEIASSRAQAPLIASSLKKIRELAWEEWSTSPAGRRLQEPAAFERYVADRIARKIERYRYVMDGARVTPSALAKWWDDVEREPEPRGSRGVTAAEVMRQAMELEEAER